MTHYETLGVPKDAGEDEIRTGYRRAAQRAHPDRPTGSHESMAAVNKALEIITDPMKRAYYDKTGQDPPSTSPEEQAQGILQSVIEQMFDQDDGDWPVVAKVREVLTGALQQTEGQLARLDLKIRMTERRRARVRKRGAGRSVLVTLLNRRLSSLEAKHAMCDAHLKLLQRAYELLNDHDDILTPDQEEERLNPFFIRAG